MEVLIEGLEPGVDYKAQVRAMNANGIVSAFSPAFYFVTATDTTAPLAPAITSWAAVGDTFVATWTPPTANEDGTAVEDLDSYVITLIDSRNEQRSYFVSSANERFEFNRETNIGAFGLYQKSLTIRIRSIDSSGNISVVPAEAFAAKPAPAPVTNLTATFSGSSIVTTWTAPTTNSDGSPLVDLMDYTVTVLAEGLLITKTFIVTQTSFTLSYEDNKAVFGQPVGAVTFTVRVRNATYDESAEVSVTSVNPPPAVPTGLKGSVLPDAIDLKWNGNTEDDMDRYEIYGNSTASDVGATLIGDVTSPQYLHPTVSYDTDHYFAVRAVDTFNSVSALSAWVGPYRPVSPFTVDTTPPAPTALTATTSTRPTTDPAAVDISWPAVTDADLAGYHIRFSKNTATRNWLYHDVVDKSATATTIEGLASATSYVFQIRSYDTMINTSAWSGDAIATSSTSALKEIATDVQVVAGGVLRSSNFDEIAKTGWRLMPSGLDILSGTVNAAVVRTGQLRSSQVIAAGLPDAGQPWWVIDTEGDATFRNAKIKGKVIVGDAAAGGTANDVAIASANYGAVGATGPQWAIRGDGTFDIKSGTGARVELSGGGLYGHNGTIETFNLSSTGTLSLDGKVTVRGGGAFYDNVSVAGNLEVYGAEAYVIARRGGAGTAWVMLDGRSGNDNAISSGSGNFSVNYDGVLTAQAVDVTGKITATSGFINGVMTVGDGLAGEKYLIVRGANSSHVVIDGRTTRSYQLYAHNGSAITFGIDNYGNAHFNGTITIGQVTDGAARSYVDGTFEVPTGAQSKADTAQNNAINDAANRDTTVTNNAANDATNKANNAQTNANNHTNNSIVNERSATTTITNKYVASSTFYTPTNGGYRLEMGYNASDQLGLTWWNGTTTYGSLDVKARTVKVGRWPNESFQTQYRVYLYGYHGIYLNGPTQVTGELNVSNAMFASSVYDGGYRVYSPVNTPPYPVTSVNGRTGAVSGLSESHSHPYLSTSGGTISGSLNITNNCSAAAYFRQGYSYYIQQVSATGFYIGDTSTGARRSFSMGGINDGWTGYPVTSSGKSFVIPHPTPAKKDTNYLVHVSIEGPTADVFYRGEGQLNVDREGLYTQERVPRAVIVLPDYFEDLTQVEGRTVSLTPIAEVCEEPGCDKFLPSALAASRVKDGKFTVYQIAGYMHDHAKFYWEVKAVRKDIPPTEVEPSTEQYTIGGDGPYTYLVPRT